ncbi:MAG: metal ABC transporter solute-binding protein, Zn/Mn family [Candidatus Omnitrophota bacterium]
MKTMKLVPLIILIGLFILDCNRPPTPGEMGEKPMVTVTVLPQKYFVQRIVGNNFEVNVMIPPGHNAATYSPTPQQMRSLSQSKLYFKIGNILFESAWLANIASNNRNMKIVDTSNGVEFIKGHSDEHQPSDIDPHTGMDPHTWLSPKAVKIQAKNILDAVVNLDSRNRTFYENNYKRFIEDIDLLDNEIKTLISQCKDKKFMVFHPAWTYFARDYGLEQFSIESEGKSPSPAELKLAIDTAREKGIHIIFIQKQFDTNMARSVAEEIKGQVVVIDPLAEDWMDNMKRMAQSLYHALK